MTMLVVAAVEVEAAAIRRAVPPDADVVVASSGVGPVAATALTAKMLARGGYTRVLCAGIAGGFAARANVGDVVVATAAVAADLGCRTEEGFLTLRDMGLDQADRIDFDGTTRWVDALTARGLSVASGEVLTLSCMTGTDADGEQLADRYPDAVAEAMEGWGVAWAARDAGVPAGEVRVVSNVIGRREPSAWDLSGALATLTRAFAVLLSESLL